MLPVSKRLKTATKPQHDSLERYGYSKEIMKGTLTLTQYQELLAKNFLLHQELEKQIEEVCPISVLKEIDFASRKKTELLFEELSELGSKELPSHYSLPENSLIRNEYEALGAVYVLEGSTLGGAMICKALEKIPAINEKASFSFYGCYGNQIGTKWKDFISFLDQKVDKEEKAQQVIESAKRTFGYFEKVFQQYA